MKKYLLMCSALLGVSYFGYAQVGIGTKDPNISAALDIRSLNGDKGVLLPKVMLTDVNELTPVAGNKADSSIIGLIVYNTNHDFNGGAAGKEEGFYFWSGNQWNKLTDYKSINDVVRYKEVGGKAILVYTDVKGDEKELDFTKLQVNTFVRRIEETDVATGAKKLKGYTYFNEDVITKWIENNADKAKDYESLIPHAEGKHIDVIGAITSNFEEIINNPANSTYISNFINNVEGNVAYGKISDAPDAKEVLYSVSKDDTGKEVKKVIDISNTIKEILTNTETELVTELREAVTYDISSEIGITNIKYNGKVVGVFSNAAVIEEGDAEVKGVKLPKALWDTQFKVFDIKLYDNAGNLVTSDFTDFSISTTEFSFAIGSNEMYSTLPGGNYNVVIYYVE